MANTRRTGSRRKASASTAEANGVVPQQLSQGVLPSLNELVRSALVDELRARPTPLPGTVANVPTNQYIIPNVRDLVQGSFRGLAEAYQRYVKAHEDLQGTSPTSPDYMSKADAAMHVTQDYLSAAENYTLTLGHINGAR